VPFDADFGELTGKIERFETEVNPARENLHFGVSLVVDESTILKLTALVESCLAVTLKRRDVLTAEVDRLYESPWYDLFLLVSRVTLNVASNGLVVHPDSLTALADCLVEMCELTIVEADDEDWEPYDITKRNFEALGNLIYAFPETAEHVRAKGGLAQRAVSRLFILDAVASGLSARRRDGKRLD